MKFEINELQQKDFMGVVMPWYTHPCLDFLQTDHGLPAKGTRVFEYGAGFSTLWWRSRGCEVTAVETSAEWADSVDAIHQPDPQLFPLAISGTYDIVVIDGIERTRCLAPALNALRKGGWLIIDNVEWWSAEDLAPLERMVSYRFPQPDHEEWVTTIWEVPCG